MAADNTTRHLASRSGLSLCLPADCTPSRAVGPCLPTAAAVFLSTQRWRHKLALRSNSLYGNCLIFLVFRASGRCPGCGMYQKLTRWAFTVAVTCQRATGRVIGASHSLETERDWTSDQTSLSFEYRETGRVIGSSQSFARTTLRRLLENLACQSAGKTFGMHLTAFPNMEPPMA